jgi:hypothetical protein
MGFTKLYNKSLAERLKLLMSEDELYAFRVICGKKDYMHEVPEKVLDNLKELGLIRFDVNLMDNKMVVLLTPRGKKVKEFV